MKKILNYILISPLKTGFNLWYKFDLLPLLHLFVTLVLWYGIYNLIFFSWIDSNFIFEIVAFIVWPLLFLIYDLILKISVPVSSSLIIILLWCMLIFFTIWIFYDYNDITTILIVYFTWNLVYILFKKIFYISK